MGKDLARDYHLRRHKQLCQEWIRYHIARREGIERESKIMLAHHTSEFERYQRMLSQPTSRSSQ